MNTSDQNAVTTEPAASERLVALKQRADNLGITYGAKIGEAKLSDRIEEHLAMVDEHIHVPGPTLNPQARELDNKALHAQQQEKLRKEQLKLVRVVVNNLDPNKREWEGEIFTVSNDLIGTVKKYIPFNHQVGWHIPQIMLNVIKDKKCQIFSSRKSSVTGITVHTTKSANAYGIEVLPPLTPSELEKLAKQQTHDVNPD